MLARASISACRHAQPLDAQAISANSPTATSRIAETVPGPAMRGRAVRVARPTADLAVACTGTSLVEIDLSQTIAHLFDLGDGLASRTLRSSRPDGKGPASVAGRAPSNNQVRLRLAFQIVVDIVTVFLKPQYRAAMPRDDAVMDVVLRQSRLGRAVDLHHAVIVGQHGIDDMID